MLSHDLARRFYLGRLCQRHHRFADSNYSLRKKSNHGCKICNDTYVRTSMARNGHPPIPELPPHLAFTAFLSPITCNDPTHRYRGRHEWTLRFLADETCVMCATQLSHKGLTGD